MVPLFCLDEFALLKFAPKKRRDTGIRATNLVRTCTKGPGAEAGSCAFGSPGAGTKFGPARLFVVVPIGPLVDVVTVCVPGYIEYAS
jgi:hypothetical protein